MPELPVKETRRPELRLPEFKREDIIRALSEMRRPEVDLKRLERSLPDRPKLDLPDFDLPRVDMRRLLEDAAIRAGVRQKKRSAWPMIGGIVIVLGLGVLALLSRPAVRVQVERSARKARVRIDKMREERESMELGPEDIALPVADGAWSDPDVTAKVPVAVMGDADPTDDAADAILTFEETGTSV
jgi:hypothetical protein